VAGLEASRENVFKKEDVHASGSGVPSVELVTTVEAALKRRVSSRVGLKRAGWNRKHESIAGEHTEGMGKRQLPCGTFMAGKEAKKREGRGGKATYGAGPDHASTPRGRRWSSPKLPRRGEGTSWVSRTRWGISAKIDGGGDAREVFDSSGHIIEERACGGVTLVDCENLVKESLRRTLRDNGSTGEEAKKNALEKKGRPLQN